MVADSVVLWLTSMVPLREKPFGPVMVVLAELITMPGATVSARPTVPVSSCDPPGPPFWQPGISNTANENISAASANRRTSVLIKAGRSKHRATDQTRLHKRFPRATRRFSESAFESRRSDYRGQAVRMSTFWAVSFSLAGVPASTGANENVTSMLMTGGRLNPNCGAQSTDPVTALGSVDGALPAHGRATAPISAQSFGNVSPTGGGCVVSHMSKSKQRPLGLASLLIRIRSTPPTTEQPE
jgi:hypothetical protein